MIDEVTDADYQNTLLENYDNLEPIGGFFDFRRGLRHAFSRSPRPDCGANQVDASFKKMAAEKKKGGFFSWLFGNKEQTAESLNNQVHLACLVRQIPLWAKQ